MLKYLRTHQKTVLWIILGFITIPFIVYYGAPGDGGQGDQEMRYVARVNDKPIPWHLYENEQQGLQQQLRMEAEQQRQPINRSREKMIPQMAYDNVIAREILRQESERLGIRVSQEDIVQTFNMELDRFVQQVNNPEVSRTDLAQYYINQYGSEEAVMADIENRILLNKMVQIPNFGSLISEEDLKEEFRKRNQKARVEFIGFKPEDYEKEVQSATPTDEELNAWFEKNKEKYKTPRQVKVRWAQFTSDQFADAAERDLADDAIRRKYNELAEQNFRTPEKRRVQDMIFKVEEFVKDATVTEESILQYYRDHMDKFTTPERARVRYVSLAPEDVMHEIQVTDAEAAQYYSENLRNYVIPVSRQMNHILVSVPRVHSDAEEAAALVEVASAQARIAAGESFEAVASEMSDDKSNSGNGGDLGIVRRDGTMVKPFEDAAFALGDGEISGPVRTQFGYHLIKAGALIPATTRTLEEARPEINSALQREGARKLAYEKLSVIRNSLEGGLTQEAVGEGLTLVDTLAFSRDDQEPIDPTIGEDMPNFAGQALNLKVGEVSRVVYGRGDRVYLIERLEKLDPQPRPLSEVRADVVADLTRESGARMAGIKCLQARLLIETEGMAFDDVAAEFVLDVTHSGWLTQSEQMVPGVGASPVNYLNAVFDAAPGEIFDATGPDGSWHLLRLLEIQESEVTPFESADPQVIGRISDEVIRQRATSLASKGAAYFLTACQEVIDASRGKIKTAPSRSLDELFELIASPADTASATASNRKDILNDVRGIKTGMTDFFGPGESMGDLGYNAEVAEAAIALGTDSVQLGTFADGVIESGRQPYYEYFVIQIVDRRVEHIPVLDEVREKVLEDYRHEQAVELARKAAEEAHAKIMSALPAGYPVAGATRSVNLRQIARDNNYKHQIPAAFGREDYIEGVGPSPAFAKTAFELKPGMVSGVVTTVDAYAPDPDKEQKTTGFYIIQVLGEEPASEEAFAAERDNLYDELLRTRQSLAYRAWYDGLKARAKIEDLRNPQA